MNLEKRIQSFLKLGQILQEELNTNSIENIIWRANSENIWFTPEFIRASMTAIATEFLDENKLIHWTSKYDLSKNINKKIGVVMAGNIPAVGFHDALCVLMSGHSLMAKLSSTDTVLMKYLLTKLIDIEPLWQQSVEFVERINDADAYIATGSNNTARYFEYYFAKKPHIIRKNRTSVAILDGSESKEDLTLLGYDILQYFGLGCRNVAKLYVPKGYDFASFYEAIEPLANVYIGHHKYFNNYEYNKSIYLVNQNPHFDNGFLILKEDSALVSPISVVFFEYYDNIDSQTKAFEQQSSQIQCIVSKNSWFKNSIDFGQAQCPNLDDFADGVDTIHFLSNL